MNEKHEQMMKRAIEAAEEARAEGGVAIGSVLVNEATGEIVARGGSLVMVRRDPTAHAEVNCIRAAAEALGADLFGYALYSTLEPCHMCLSAAAWAKIQTVYFGAYRKDVDKNLFDINDDRFSDELEAARMNLRENATMVVTGGILEQQCAALLDGYHSVYAHTV